MFLHSSHCDPASFCPYASADEYGPGLMVASLLAFLLQLLLLLLLLRLLLQLLLLLREHSSRKGTYLVAMLRPSMLDNYHMSGVRLGVSSRLEKLRSEQQQTHLHDSLLNDDASCD